MTKITPLSKAEKQILSNDLNEIFKSNKNWVESLKDIDTDILCKSISQILNAQLDYVPDSIKQNNHCTVLDVLSNYNTVFRFAPAPSGYLHIGHFVPLLLNILLKTVSSKFKQSKLIFRIDDTNPNDDDYSAEIKQTLNTLQVVDFTESRSSTMAQTVIDMIEKTFTDKTGRFYVDFSSKDVISLERNTKKESVYRTKSLDEQLVLWERLKVETNGVVRAKINMASNNGNLRDPVVLRYVEINGSLKLMPTYDLICPVLDSLDSDSDNVMIALRDANYQDRLELYCWIQSALNLKQTAVLTFSRINFENVLLSKRKIKQLIELGVVESWSDPRLMTIDGLKNRGMTLQGLVNFYWLAGRLSVGNRSTSQEVDSLFSFNDKVLAQRQNFIIDRYPITFKPPIEKIDSYMIVRIKACIDKKITNSRSKTKFLSTNDLSDDNDNLIPDLVEVQKIVCMKDRLISWNLKLIIDFTTQNNLHFSDLDNGSSLIEKFNLDGSFKTCSDVTVGDILKINNFKDTDDPVFAGYYLVTSKSKEVNFDCMMDVIDVMFSN